MGAVGTRPSPRPLDIKEGHDDGIARAQRAARTRMCVWLFDRLN